MAAFAVLAPAALAQQPPRGNVVAECKPLAFQSRPGAPVVVDWTLTWTGKGVLQGDLEFAAWDDDGTRAILLGQFRVRDLVLSNVRQSTRMLLPPLDVRGSLAQAMLRGEFVTREGRLTLAEQVVFVPAPGKRVFTIGVPSAAGPVPSPGINDLVQHALAFERFDPSPLDAQNRVVTVPNWVLPEDFPRDPLLLCVFDLVALVDDGLSELRQEQLDAVRDWVDAGGGAFVRPGELVEPRHVEFLNKLARLDGNPAGFRLDEQQKLAWPDDWDPAAVKLHRKGLGRVVFAPRPAEAADQVPRDTFDTPEWREAGWFLWRLREQLRAPILGAGQWQGPAGDGPLRPQSFGVQPLQSGGWLLERLIPESVQLVPLWIVGCILALFVVVVGPLDYFVLGLFRLRKLTWVVFPIVALAFAWFTVWLSNRYMQTSEQNRSLVILDVGDAGRIARSSELKLYFANTSRANDIESQQELIVPVDHRRFGTSFDGNQAGAQFIFDPDSGVWREADPQGDTFYGPAGAPGSRATPGPAGGRQPGELQQLIAPPEYVYRAPATYALAEWLPQWTPHLHRRFQILPEGDFVAFAWETLRPPDFSSPTGAERLRESVVAQFGSEVSIAVLHRDQRQVITDRAGLFAAGSRSQPAGAQAAVTPSFVFELCARPDRHIDPQVQAMLGGTDHVNGLFSLVSQIAPTGGDNFEDLALLDPTDDRQWLLLVAVRKGTDWHLYRKLYVVE